MTTEEFIKRAKLKHGDVYDYSLAKYINNKTKVTILCKKHGEFEQRPANHLQGQGCPKCGFESGGRKRSLDISAFINKANAVHNYFYDYSKVDYKNTDTKVCIVCPIHGEFWQTPHDHLGGHNCPICGSENIIMKKKTGREKFIELSKEKHNNKYDYSKVHNFDTLREKVLIICPEHGEFWQEANPHLHGVGCPKCAGVKKWTKETFIEKANFIHDNKYDYSDICYINVETNIKIKCPIHGEFWQTPHSHLQGAGCPICKSSRGEIKINQFLRKHNINYSSQHKLKIENKLLFVDFCITAKNKLYFIEYNGIQHYKPIDHFGGEVALFKQMSRDKLLKEYCAKNDIELLIIKYNISLKDIEQILLKQLLQWKILSSQEDLTEKSK